MKVNPIQNRLPLIIGHRGASADAPENTLAAFDLALKAGADGVEFDVRLACDRIPVVIHDATLRRTARREGQVAALTSAELRRLDVCSWFGRNDMSGGVPTLDETLELVGKRSRTIYVEMKFETADDYAALAAEVVESVKRQSLEGRAVIKSFNHASLSEIKRLAPEIRTAALFKRTFARPLLTTENVVSSALACGADEVSLHRTLLRDETVLAARERGLDTLVWTIDTHALLRRATLMGVSVVFTNRPAHLRAALESLKSHRQT